MGRGRDLTGERFGRLVVIKKLEAIRLRQSDWRCKCDCGNEVDVLRSYLTRGHTRSCGCLRQDKAPLNNRKKTDLTGERFGRLVVMGRVEPLHGRLSRWKCKCDCGQIKDVDGKSLTSGATRSCGCLRRDKARKTKWKYN